jgi:hypothetical protein
MGCMAVEEQRGVRPSSTEVARVTAEQPFIGEDSIHSG